MNFNNYKMQEDMPRKIDFTTRHYYKNGVKVATKIGAAINEYNSTVKDCVTETIVDEELYKTKVKEFEKAKNELNRQFEIDLARELNLQNHPNWGKLYELANDYSDGSFEDMYRVAEEWSELLY